VAVDGTFWQNRFDMAWKPVFSPDGRHAAVRAQRNGKYTVAVNDRPWARECEMAWDPVFSPDGSKLLLRTIEGGTYFRRVMPVADITG
jgi:WD40-like Beta Propeller Repeat